MVHKCYTIETYLLAYGHNIMPMRDRAHWEQVNGIVVHPPIYKKKMGRPPKNRKKTPEEKIQKDASIALNKKGVSMHCSICGKADHNKRAQQCNKRRFNSCKRWPKWWCKKGRKCYKRWRKCNNRRSKCCWKRGNKCYKRWTKWC